MVDHAANRDVVVRMLREELVGPAPAGTEIDVSAPVVISDARQAYGPYRQQSNGEEILTRDPPTKRYGVGVIFPQSSVRNEAELAAAESMPVASSDEPAAGTREPQDASFAEFKTRGKDDSGDDFDLSAANSLQPSSLGVSFLAELTGDATLVLSATGGRYETKQVTVDRVSRTWWVRVPVTVNARIPAAALLGSKPNQVIAGNGRGHHLAVVETTGTGELDLRFEVLARPHGNGLSLLTVCLVNRTSSDGRATEVTRALFQAHFSGAVTASDGDARILPYPTPRARTDPEQAGLDLLYRDMPVFATGHGCAADWERVPGARRARLVTAEVLPAVELPTITPDITRADGTALRVSMRSLVAVAPGDEAWTLLEDVVSEYEDWIGRQDQRVSSGEMGGEFIDPATANLAACWAAARRMRKGLAYLAANPFALQAFRLANEAILLQQVATGLPARPVSFDGKTDRIVVGGTFVDPAQVEPRPGKGNWRAFQVAFLLASVESTGNQQSSDREQVELIWFPTGGGKTEAYLGLAAFSMFKRRLEDPADDGVDVLMRYTLRLLTTQQFERASSLICAMEQIRQREAIGGSSFSIGIWLGGDTTPNRRDQAVREYNSFKRDPREENPFLLAQCPWCGAQFERVWEKSRKGKVQAALTPGYRLGRVGTRNDETVQFSCPERSCAFYQGLPIYIVDEDVYDVRPTMVIATIDKFAMLAWRDEPRSLFGIGPDGDRVTSPPGLIIQDELHLISGPLGSLAGMFEPVVDELCTDSRGDPPVVPKIVCSTATIRRYQDQVKGLYGREAVALFPPPGLEAGDSFFARFDESARGRMYLGVHAPSFLSYQTEWVRALTALMQAPAQLDPEERDPWWTMLMFCNSIRDMGTAHTLLDADVRDYARVMWGRAGETFQRRYFKHPLQELTGGLRRSEISKAMSDLGRDVLSGEGAIDVCLASNIIEVGIDIPRLSLMVVAGQPKSTAQYIQVTGRVGRDPQKPGLVVTLYGPSKPRDRSHFERFRSYHERLYSQVEPTSVTPFSTPALDRALHAVLVSYVRQAGSLDEARSPWPFPGDAFERVAGLLRARAKIVDETSLPALESVLERRRNEWREWQASYWGGWTPSAENPLIRPAGAYVNPEQESISWPTMTSMRNVDAECESEITTRYAVSNAQKES
jgi:hypothetical protein